MVGNIVSEGSIVVINGVQISGTTSGTKGSGKRAADTRELPAFERISNRLMGDVVVTVDPNPKPQAADPQQKEFGYREPAPEGELPTAFYVVVEGDDNIVPMVHTEVHHGRLEISMKSGSYSSRVPLKVRVVTKHLTEIRHDGHGLLEANGVEAQDLEIRHSGMGDLLVRGTGVETRAILSGHGNVVIGPFQAAKAIDLVHSGMGDVTLTGTVNGLHARLSGHGDINCQALSAKTVNADISGMGNAWLNTERILGHHSGHGDVIVRGTRGSLQGLSSSGMGDVRYT